MKKKNILPKISQLPLSNDKKVYFNKIDSMMDNIINNHNYKNIEEPNNNQLLQINQTLNSPIQNNFQIGQMKVNNYNNFFFQNNKIIDDSPTNFINANLFPKNQIQYPQNETNYLQNQPSYKNIVNSNKSDPSSDNIIELDNSSEKKAFIPIKGNWNHEEDEKLISAVMETNPIVWDIVASKVPGRSPIQCKERWLYRLHPDVNKSKFEKWEDEIIINEREKMGNSWTYISTKLKGRTSCAVKNRWYCALRKRKK